MLTFNQVFSVPFFAGAMLIFTLMVAVTDLAFGWSTTLQIEATQVHTWVAALAAPWASLFPSLVPDLSLVEVSRFFRLEGFARLRRGASLRCICGRSGAVCDRFRCRWMDAGRFRFERLWRALPAWLFDAGGFVDRNHPDG